MPDNQAVPYAWPLTALALSLSGVTALSVFLAIHALIDDRLLAALFAGAAVLLDLTKYLAWPLSAYLMSVGRDWLAAALISCALVLAGVSSWATYDRLMSAILGSHGEAVATQQRIKDVEAARSQDQSRLDALDADERVIQGQLSDLRGQSVVSKSLELERVALRRLDAQREQVRSRLDETSQQLALLRSQPVRTASLPPGLASLLCIGFALALELVPALLLMAVRGVSGQKQLNNAPETLPKTPETVSGPANNEGDEHLQTLLRSIVQADPGSPIVLREFARTARIGNVRAIQIFRTAEALGALRKTTSGSYVVA